MNSCSANIDLGYRPLFLKNKVSLLILIEGNFDEKSFAFAAILIDTWQATTPCCIAQI
jgi:hypothetical protein